MGEQTLFSPESSLEAFNPWIMSMRDRIQNSFLTALVQESAISKKKREFDFELSKQIREKREYSFFLSTVKSALAALRESGVECKEWDKILA